MQKAIASVSAYREDQTKFYLLFGAVYPLVLASEAISRAASRFSPDATPSGAWSSVFKEAKEQASIVASYLLMARASLQTFGRRPRTERPS